MAFGGKFDDRDDVASDINVTPMVDVMLDRLETALGMPVTAIATGGLARCVISHCRRPVTLDDQLLLRGLAVMYRREMT